ncbi:SNF5-domain-containing protein [Anaeromyces robustus]|uniref:SNF5-domain-containing protein n=1 Tax=Anaeromyces robustus TaxID=1754192 RepID=A0A1Y1WWS7_9FUNG|nr:SNF5-domain-containing protein [Anaeromyces robustus]|eukprot:ORX78009.1 SNF5-domain-containing protein [Anaeromyces robustus]
MTRETNLYSPSAYVNPDLVEELVSESDSEYQQTKITKYPIGNIHYNVNIRRRKTRHVYYEKKQLKKAADIPVHLVPINLNFEIDGVKLVDFFTWNINESLMTPEKFAQILADDLDTPVANQFVQQIADQIRKQCSNYIAALENDNVENDYEKESDLRIIIKLDINVGTINLKDQFEWPLYSSLSNSMAPEEFAKKLTSELGLGGEFTAAIAHSIREQIYTARLNVDDTNFAMNIDRYKVPPFRSKDEEFDEWYPTIREMTEEEIERKHKEQERNIRRMRRSTKLAQRLLSTTNPSSPHSNGQKRSAEIPLTTYEIYQSQKRHNSGSDTEFSKDINSGKLSTETSGSAVYNNYLKSELSPTVSTLYDSDSKQDSSSSITNVPPLPKIHRGFGASGRIYNKDLKANITDFKKNWKCSWCSLSGLYTPTLRKGPLGNRTLCNACGLWYAKHKTLPQDRYHEHEH